MHVCLSMCIGGCVCVSATFSCQAAWNVGVGAPLHNLVAPIKPRERDEKIAARRRMFDSDNASEAICVSFHLLS